MRCYRYRKGGFVTLFGRCASISGGESDVDVVAASELLSSGLLSASATVASIDLLLRSAGGVPKNGLILSTCVTSGLAVDVFCNTTFTGGISWMIWKGPMNFRLHLSSRPRYLRRLKYQTQLPGLVF